MRVPFVNLGLQYKNLKEEIIEKIDSLSSMGQYVLSDELEKFETNFAKYCGVKYSIGVGNGSDALFFSLLALNIGKGGEVITAPNSFVATAWAIANTGAKLVFVDVNEDYNINPEKIERAINKNTKAIVPIHLTGKISKMDEINKIANKNQLWVLDDAAQSLGATFKGKPVGNLAKVTATSFFPSKPLGCYGDGGAIFTNSKKIYDIASGIAKANGAEAEVDFHLTNKYPPTINSKKESEFAANVAKKIFGNSIK